MSPAGDSPADGPVFTGRSADERDEAADATARPLTRGGRRSRAPAPPRLTAARAILGAGVSVAGVLLAVGTLLLVNDDPQAASSDGVGPAVVAAPTVLQSAPTEVEVAPSDPASIAPPAVPSAVPSPRPASPSPAAPPSTAAPRPVSLVRPITVLNNSTRPGLADRAASRFRRGGWPVRATGNFRGQISVTTVYYDPGLRASAQEFARSFRGIARVLPRFAGLPARGIVVVVTREFES